jgi:23S rRNA (cytidine1920-2'-O)/16S rRNA (cytidine1409-2'-O)-methyltransferase
MERLDKLIAQRGLAPSRERAQLLIRKGKVTVDGRIITRAAEFVHPDVALAVTGEVLPYVGKGGLKMEEALRKFKIDPKGYRCLDVGASTGGFTDCLLQHGAAHVTAIDVGHGQLHPSLLGNPRVESHEGVNARSIEPGAFGGDFDLIAVDVSFISLTLVLPPLAPLLKPGGVIIALIKPEFEAGRDAVGAKGIVRDPKARRAAVEKVTKLAVEELGLRLMGVLNAPHLGSGLVNKEFLAGFKSTGLRH